MALKLEQPTKEVLETYYQKLGLTPESITRDVATLQSWMEKQPHLPHNIDVKTLEAFLIHSKNSIERAKTKLELYYTARANIPDVFADRDPTGPTIKDISDVVMFCVCPKTSPEGNRVTTVKIFDRDVKKFDVIAAIKLGLMMIDGHMDEDKCVTHVVIFDLDNTTLGHAASMTLPVLKKIVDLFLGVYPQRFSGFHIVNVPPFFESVINLAKNLMSTKLSRRVFVHGKDPTSLHSCVSKDVLPQEYGGTYPASIEDLREKSYLSLVEKRQWFLEQTTVMAEETKRPNRKLNGLNQQLEGSFRKIAID